MRYLKNKIAIAKAHKAHQAQKTTSTASSSPLELSQSSPTPKRTKTTPEERITPESYRATKNIVKNFGKAICKFSTSSLTSPYLTTFVEKEGVNMDRFLAHVDSIRPKIDGLNHFRAVLVTTNKDSQEMISFKKIFREISEVFIKYFSVNWVFNSKIFHKEAHLKFRYKMLRRIQYPELFTYLKSSKGAKKVRN